MQRKLRTFLDALHGSKWARIIPLGLIGVIYAVSMIVWQPANIADWFKPLFINVMAACGMYFVNRFSSGTWEFNNIGVLFFSVFSALGTVIIFTGQPSLFQGEFNPGLGAGPTMFLGISMYNRYRMKKGI